MCMESIIKMKSTLRFLVGETGHDMHNIIPTDREFKVLEELLQPLMSIKSTSERLSADKPSLHIVLCCLMNILTMSQEQDYARKSEACQKFITRFEAEMERRLEDCGRSVREFCIGNLLHPRFKGILLNAKTSRDYVPHQLEDTIAFIKDMFRTEVPETENLDEATSQSILNMAMDESGWGRMPIVVTQATPTVSAQVQNISPIEAELQQWLKTTAPPTTRTDCDILEFWRDKEQDFPLLAKVARKYYSIPVTSASSERLFSTAGNVITSARTLLNTEKTEQLIFIHDNFWEIEPHIQTWKIMSDKEKAKEQQRLGATQQPQPSTSSQAASEAAGSQTPSQAASQDPTEGQIY